MKNSNYSRGSKVINHIVIFHLSIPIGKAFQLKSKAAPTWNTGSWTERAMGRMPFRALADGQELELIQCSGLERDTMSRSMNTLLLSRLE